MLYYIIPPIIIIVSFSILIFFLFRKVEQLSPEELVSGQLEPVRSGNKIGVVFSAIGQFILKVLERLMHRLKLLSLKFHNTSNDLFHFIREKRHRKIRLQQEMLEKELKANEEIVEDKVEIKPVEHFPRPMVRAEITRPQRRPEVKTKDKLEDALIKRIAFNPRDIEAYERLGDYYLESRNFRDALECFKQVLRLSPVHHKAKLRIRRIERMEK